MEVTKQKINKRNTYNKDKFYKWLFTRMVLLFGYSTYFLFAC